MLLNCGAGEDSWDSLGWQGDPTSQWWRIGKPGELQFMGSISSSVIAFFRLQSFPASGSWWWTGKPGVLRFMGLQRVRDDWVTELNWTELREHIKKKRLHFANKCRYSQSYEFSSIVYECKSWTIKKSEHRRTDAPELWCWRRLLRLPWMARRSNQSVVKEKLQYFGHLM